MEQAYCSVYLDEFCGEFGAIACQNLNPYWEHRLVNIVKKFVLELNGFLLSSLFLFSIELLLRYRTDALLLFILEYSIAILYNWHTYKQ